MKGPSKSYRKASAFKMRILAKTKSSSTQVHSDETKEVELCELCGGAKKNQISTDEPHYKARAGPDTEEDEDDYPVTARLDEFEDQISTRLADRNPFKLFEYVN